MRSSGAACTTGSASPTPRANTRSCAPRARHRGAARARDRRVRAAAARADLFKRPGIAETIEWSRALLQLDAIVLDPAIVDDTLGVLLKYQDDIAKMQSGDTAKLLEELRARAVLE